MKNRIAQLRAERDLTLTELARKVRTTPAQIQKLERGDRKLTQEWMERLAAALDVKASSLLPEEDVEFIPSAIEREFLAVLTLFAPHERGAALQMMRTFGKMLRHWQSLSVGKQADRAGVGLWLDIEEKAHLRKLIEMARDMAKVLQEHEQAGRHRKAHQVQNMRRS